MFNKTKNFIKKFKKWIIGFLLGGTALAAGLGAIDGELKEITTIDIEATGKYISVFEDMSGNKYEIIITKKQYQALGLPGAKAPQNGNDKYLYSAGGVPTLQDNEYYILNKEKFNKSNFDFEENILIKLPNENTKQTTNNELKVLMQ